MIVIGQILATDGAECFSLILIILILAKSLNSQLQNVESKNYRHYSIVRCNAYFDDSNHLCTDHQCDRQTDRMALATVQSNDAC